MFNAEIQYSLELFQNIPSIWDKLEVYRHRYSTRRITCFALYSAEAALLTACFKHKLLL